ncbi:uncharacterized protein [Arachis hypogaea]|uniref:uncharacterized protein n=1 Tax=Arachis hypogaea TaxID=3818 RepID=UPI003B20C789
MEFWFMGQGYEDHLSKSVDDVRAADKITWKKIDAQLCNLIWHTIDLPKLTMFRTYKTCKKVWDRAKALYTNNIARLYHVAKKLCSLQLQGTDMESYVEAVEAVKEEFSTLLPYVSNANDHHTQQESCFWYLRYLGCLLNLNLFGNKYWAPHPFLPLRTYLHDSAIRPLSRDPYFRPNCIGIPIFFSSVLSSAHSRRPWGRGNRIRLSCTYCHRIGHTQDKCYALHGHPTKVANVVQTNEPSDVHSAAQPQGIFVSGHDYDEFLKYQASKQASTPVALVAHSGNSVACISHSSFLGPWVLDSGASDHISGTSSVLSKLEHPAFLPSITLADGSKIGAKGISQATPLPTLPLKYVLYMPNCPFNLISISELTRSLNCSVAFFADSVIVQDRGTGQTIGTGCKHVRSSFSSHVNTRAASPFSVIYSDMSPFLRIPLFFSTPDITSPSITKVLPVPYLDGPPIPTKPLQVYHRRPRPAVQDNSSPEPVVEPSLDPSSGVSSSPPISLRQGTRSTRNPNPIYNFLSYHRLSSSHYTFTSSLSSVSIPKTTAEALSHRGWRQTMIEEMSALHSTGTWDLVPLPPGKSTVGCRWIYTIKVGSDGTIDRLKARLVAKGYTQIFGLDYGDTFSPVAKMTSVRLFLSMAAIHHWPLHQLDIKNTFLHGDLEEEVYMEQPPGFVAQGECSGLVYHLRRSLYRLKQSPRAWFSRFSVVISKFGMIQSEADHSIFSRHSFSTTSAYLVVYVDDIVITADDHEGITQLKQHLFDHFQTKDMEKLKYFLGIEVAQSNAGICISQRKYALDILEETEILDSRPIDTLMDPNTKLSPDQGEPLADPVIGTQLLESLDISKVLQKKKSKKQNVVVRSSAEAEYRAMALATCELIWLKQLIKELKFCEPSKIELVCDNQTALHIASNPVFHERTKHIEIDCHFIRERLQSGEIVTAFVNSNDQLADIFTKVLRGPRIQYICNKLGAYDLYAPA